MSHVEPIVMDDYYIFENLCTKVLSVVTSLESSVSRYLVLLNSMYIL